MLTTERQERICHMEIHSCRIDKGIDKRESVGDVLNKVERMYYDVPSNYNGIRMCAYFRASGMTR